MLARLRTALRDRFGIVVTRAEYLYPWQLDPRQQGGRTTGEIPASARAYLRPDNPRLQELIARYRAADPRLTGSQIWTESTLSPEHILRFRGDNPFVYQTSGPNMNAFSHALTYYYLKDRLGSERLSALEEDGAFGATLFDVDGRSVTRDLLDSAGEIDFLLRHVGAARRSWNVLDIGAGYGRLAHRLHQSTGSGVRIYCTDAVPTSTFICEYYLRHRGLERARAVPLDEVGELLESTRIDVATNIHSFSECSPTAIDAWVEMLAKHSVPFLMVIPNAMTNRGERCLTVRNEEMEPIFERHGYRSLVREPRFADAIVQTYGVDPIHLHLFKLG